MKKIKFCFIVVILLALVNSVSALEIKPGDLFHITGCENGELVVPIVNMWSEPGGIGAGAKVVGKLSGDGRADQGLECQGAMVELLEKTKYQRQNILESKVGG